MSFSYEFLKKFKNKTVRIDYGSGSNCHKYFKVVEVNFSLAGLGYIVCYSDEITKQTHYIDASSINSISIDGIED